MRKYLYLPFSFVAAAVYCALFMDTGQLAALIICSAVHELGHLLAAQILGARQVRLTPGVFGFVITYAFMSLSPLRQAVAALAGPTAGLCLAVVCFAMPGSALHPAGSLSIVLSLFNLLPLSMLDGGAALSGVMQCFFSPAVCRKVSFFSDLCVLSLIFAVSVRSALNGALSALFVSACLIISYCRTAKNEI